MAEKDPPDPIPTCHAKHTPYQPTRAEFCCPWCAAPVGDFYVDEGPSYECPALHVEDVLHCIKCDERLSGQSFVKRLADAKNLIPCPTCAGKGVVKSAKAKAPSKAKAKAKASGTRKAPTKKTPAKRHR